MRNLNPPSGLLNGFRLIIKQLKNNLIEAEIDIWPFKNKRVFLQRITLNSTEEHLPFIFKRRQFPIKPAFALTINKSQGQTLEK